MPDFKFGDMICLGRPPDELTAWSDHCRMYVNQCSHPLNVSGEFIHVIVPGTDPVDIRLGVFEVEASGWVACRHKDGSVRVIYDGKDVTDRVIVQTIGSSGVQITSDLDGPFEIIYEPAP